MRSFLGALLLVWVGASCKSEQPPSGEPVPGAGAADVRARTAEGAAPVTAPGEAATTRDCEALIKATRERSRATGQGRKPVCPGGICNAMRDMYECRMVLRDDPAFCQLVEPAVRANCVALYRFFHAARNAGPDTSWPGVLAEAIRDDCLNSFDGVPSADCERMVQAIRDQKPESCPTSPAPLHQMCSAVAASDPKRCSGDKDCEELAGRLALLKQGGGLKRIASESTRRDRIHARAALGIAGACDPEEEVFRKACAEFERP